LTDLALQPWSNSNVIIGTDNDLQDVPGNRALTDQWPGSGWHRTAGSHSTRLAPYNGLLLSADGDTSANSITSICGCWLVR